MRSSKYTTHKKRPGGAAPGAERPEAEAGGGARRTRGTGGEWRVGTPAAGAAGAGGLRQRRRRGGGVSPFLRAYSISPRRSKDEHEAISRLMNSST